SCDVRWAMTDGRWPMFGRCEAFGHVRWDVRGSYRTVRQFRHARDLPRSACDPFSVSCDLSQIRNRSIRHVRDAHVDIEFLLEFQRPDELARSGDPGPTDGGILGVNTQPRFTPKGILSVLEILEEAAEVN